MTPPRRSSGRLRTPPGRGRSNGRETIVDATTGAVLADRVRRADTFLTRLIGLLGRDRLERNEALWIRPCKGIHTLGMKFPIDAIFLDRRLQVVALRQDVAPWRATSFVRRAASVLELPAGSIRRRGVAVGNRLDVVRTGAKSKSQSAPKRRRTRR